MPSKVYTESICDRCGISIRRENASAFVPEVEWAMLWLHYRAAGSGWSGGGRSLDVTLCPACAAAVEEFIKTKPC